MTGAGTDGLRSQELSVFRSGRGMRQLLPELGFGNDLPDQGIGGPASPTIVRASNEAMALCVGRSRDRVSAALMPRPGVVITPVEALDPEWNGTWVTQTTRLNLREK